MDTKYLDNIIVIVSQYEDIELIQSQYWETIFNNLYLTHELLKNKKFQLFEKINPDFFYEDIICLDLLCYDNPPYSYVPDVFLNSSSFWIHLTELDYTYTKKIPESFLQSNKQFCFWLVEKFKQHPVVHYLPTSLQNDFDLGYLAVNMNPENFKALSFELKDNLYIYEIIFKNKKIKSADYFKLAGTNIRANYKFAKRSIIENASTFAFVDSTLKDSSAFFLDMMNYSDHILKYANKNIQNNELYVTASIEKNPLSIEYAHSRLKSSVNFLISIHDNIIKYPHFIEFAKLIDSSVFNNFSFIDKYFDSIVENAAYYLLGRDIVSDYNTMKKFVCCDINAFAVSSENLKKDITFLQECYDFHNQKNILHQFEPDSYQSSIFKMLSDNQLNDIKFIHNLYTGFKPIFKEIVFPIIQKRKTALTNLLSNELNVEQGINHLLEKFDLKNKLEHQFQSLQKEKGKKI